MMIENVTKRYGQLTVLDGFSLPLDESGTTALMGPSGCGKTTLLRLIAGLESPDAGKINTGGRKISMVFQEDRLIPALSALGNVMVALPPGPGSKKLAMETLAACGITSAADKPASELSGGMRRRVAIARAVAFGGDILILDEPFKGLDAETKEITAAFVFSHLKPGATAILVTHDQAEAARWATRVISLGGPPLSFIKKIQE